MKKTARFLGVLAALLLALCPFAARSENSRKLTLMVYMCGSNLESGYGSASQDILEMTSAGIGKDVTVLVMTGGSERWQLGYDAGTVSILEIGARGQRTVWTDGTMNMGEAATLTRLLTYGMENRPAEEYALILWDHGGGPVEGVCWDELFSMDHLSLTELTGALCSAQMGGKLKWIGFDACLMSSLEVASALSPYAEYMIASQETEPAFGWNYSFLHEIENDETGADTGRRIVDAYFADREDYRDVMTLACLDLSKTAEIEESMDVFFRKPSLEMTPETFSVLSNLRGDVTGFGMAVRGTGEDGYDLVDARGLILSFGSGDAETARLSEQLEEMVTYSRANEEGASGVSLYHPYANKIKFEEKWREEYGTLHFSAGYTEYVNAFGTVLTGGEITDWSGLETEDAGIGEDRENLFSMQLTPEQRENFASAQLLVMNDIFSDVRLEDYCALVYTGEARMDEDGLLTASYTGKTLYVEQEDGSLYGPVPFGLTDEGRFACVRMIYLPEGTSDPEHFTHVAYYLDAAPDAEYPEIVRTRVWDRATQTYTSRILFEEDQYAYLHLVETGRKYPEEDERGLLPMYEIWEESDGMAIGGLDIRLPDRWRFRWVERQTTGEQLYALFQVTDVQQNMFCSPPFPVQNPYLQDYAGIPENADPAFGLTASVIDSPAERGVRFTLTPGNQAEAGTEYSFSNLILNGERMSRTAPRTQQAGEDGTLPAVQLFMEAEELYGLERIDTVRLTIAAVRDGEPTAYTEVSFRFENCEFPGLCSDVRVLAETEQDGAVLQLLSANTWMGTGAEFSVLFRNGRDEAIVPYNDPVIGGTELKHSPQEAIPAGRSVLRKFTFRNSLDVTGTVLETTDENPYFYVTLLSDHLLQHRGVTEISEIVLYAGSGKDGGYGESFFLRLTEPWELRDEDLTTLLNTSMSIRDPEETVLQPTGRTELAENNQYSVACGTILTGKNGIALQLEITNRTERPLTVYAADPSLNGEPAVFRLNDGWTVAPGAVRITGVVIAGEESAPVSGIRSVGFRFESEEQREQQQEAAASVLTFTEPLQTGEKRAEWISADRIRTEKVMMPETVIPEPKEILTTDTMLEETVSLPENAGTLTRWIPANLTAEQEERAEGGNMFLVQKTTDGKAVILVSMHKMIRGEDGHFGTRFSGLLLCPEEYPGILITNVQGWPDFDHLDVFPVSVIAAYDEDMDWLQETDELTVRADFSENGARITELSLTGEGGDMTSITVVPMGKFIPEEGEELTPPVLSWKTGTNVLKAEMNGKPVRLSLRPVTEEDELYVIFSVRETDGTEYSLPMFPYPAGTAEPQE